MSNAQVTKEMAALTADLKGAFGDDLLSVVLYGSAARADYLGRGGSDLNVVVVLRDISLGSLERGTSVTRAWESGGNRPLLFFSPEWIARSSDVFPLEFLDMVEWHDVAYGADPFTGLQVSMENLRLQCESELKTKLLHLRTGYVRLHEDSDALARLLAASYAPITTLCRGVLRLAGATVPDNARDVVHAAAAICGFDRGPLEEVAAVKKGGPGAASTALKPLFSAYYTQVETLARAVDAGLIIKGAKQ